MKRVYWRPTRVSRAALVLIALVALVALLAVEKLPVQRKQPWYSEKIAAARLAEEALRVIKAERLRRGLRIDPAVDPARTGLLGPPFSPVTSNTGYLAAKRTSVNPNFAAVIVHLLKEAGVQPGDAVAVGVSGSFPALNIATYAALQVLGTKPLVITSTAASEWGANFAEFMWPDMERALLDRDVFEFRSAAASRGGIEDRGRGMSEEGRRLLDRAIERNALIRIDPSSLADAVERRMELYDELAGTRPIKAYVNVGGGTASVGTHVGKKLFEPGVHVDTPRGVQAIADSVMLRFLERDVPVVHLSGVSRLAREHGLPLEPATMPRVGVGTVYMRAEYNRWLAGGGLLAIFGAMLAFIRMDVGQRLLRRRERPGGRQPEQMI